MSKIIRKRFGELLVSAGIVTEQDIDYALENKLDGERIGDALVRLELTTEARVLDALEAATGHKRVNIRDFRIKKDVLEYIPEDYARSKNLIPLQEKDGLLMVAMSDPIDYITIDDLRLLIGRQIEIYIAAKTDISNAIEKYYGFTKTLADLGVTEEFDLTTDFTLEQDYSNPMIELVDQILTNAVLNRASDIHINPHEDFVRIKYRVDGVLLQEMQIPKELASQLSARVKVMASMDVTETRTPLDGRIRTVVDDRDIDLRISTIPTVNGEKIVMRILDLTQSSSTLTKLGFSKKDSILLDDILNRPNGIILVSGPTGSGKSTTLYSFLSQLDSEEDNIITVEDPVERQMDGIHQVQVREEVNMTFASALRAILRQDPDTIMVGEIRDAETASISVRAALTGHLVLSTIHTNDSVSTIPRLIDMGVEPFLVSSSLNSVIAQRLVRVVCPECSHWDEPTRSEKALFESRGIKIKQLKRAVGCVSCNNKGYRNRVGIYEILIVDDKMRRMISDGASVMELMDHANKHGMKYLIDDGLHKVKAGITTLEEVIRVAVTPEEE